MREIAVEHATRVKAELLRRAADGGWPAPPEEIGADGALRLESIAFAMPAARRLRAGASQLSVGAIALRRLRTGYRCDAAATRRTSARGRLPNPASCNLNQPQASMDACAMVERIAYRGAKGTAGSCTLSAVPVGFTSP
jgi:hypothetical protein